MENLRTINKTGKVVSLPGCSSLYKILPTVDSLFFEPTVESTHRGFESHPLRQAGGACRIRSMMIAQYLLGDLNF
jgi:hypothetical protein